MLITRGCGVVLLVISFFLQSTMVLVVSAGEVNKRKPKSPLVTKQEQRAVRPAPASLSQAIEQIRQEAEQLERSPSTNETLTMLAERLQTQPEVRVVVILRAVFHIPDELAGTLKGQAQRIEIARLRDQFLSRVVGYDPNSVKTYNTLPFVALSVNTTGLAWLRSSPLVIAVEEDIRHKPTVTDNLALMQADQAWAAGYTGEGQTVALLDTGVDKNHSMLTGKVVAEACYSTNDTSDFASSLCPGGTPSSTAENSSLPCAFDCAHGTHVAGIISGNPVQDQGRKLSGVAPDARLISIQVFSRITDREFCSSGQPCLAAYTSDILSGLNRVYELHHTYSISAVNLSLGSGAYRSTAECDAGRPTYKLIIDLLQAAKIATIAASGNGGLNGSVTAPACISTAIGVGATNESGQGVAGFSNTAPFLKLLAPGMSIMSATPNGEYATLSGTSMAAPHVAGAWAILHQASPESSVSEILDALQATSQPLADSRNGVTFPRVQLSEAIQSLASTPPPANPLSISVPPPSSSQPNRPAGLSATANQVNVTPQSTPAAPSNLVATAFSSTQINLRWTDQSADETSFRVERKLGAGGTWAVRETLAANVTLYSDLELGAGTYFYRISAVNGGVSSTTSNEASATTLATPGAGTARESLTQNRTYFVSPTGSDSNNGLTSGAAFATLQHAFNLIESTLDLKGNTVMIQASTGTYTSGILIRNWTGGGEINLDLGGGTIHVTGGNAIATSGVLGGALRLQNGTLRTTTSGGAIAHAAAGSLIIDSGITFGTTAGNHINVASPGSLVTVAGSYTITGGAASHIAVNGSGTIFRHIRGTVTINGGGGAIVFSNVFANAAYGGFVYSGASYAIVNGSVTGRRYQSFLNSIIETTRGSSHFPGTVDGIAVIGGQYR